MKWYRKRPIVFQAEQQDKEFEVETLEGTMKIIKELAGVETKMNSISSGDLYYIAWNQDKQEEALESIGKLVRKLNKIIKKEKELNK